MEYEDILQLLSQCHNIVSCEDIVAELTDLLSSLGFRYFAFLQHVRSDADLPEYYLVGNFPEEWLHIYSERNYALIDPVALYLRKSQVPFRWCDAVEAFHRAPNASKMRRVVRAASDYGLIDGYIFPVYSDRGLVGNLSVGGEPRNLTTLQIGLLDTLSKNIFWQILRYCKPRVADALTAPVRVQLTRRELEVLSHLADGLTSNDIGTALGISSNTVDWYMSGIQSKLNARNRHHAVAIAFRLGLAA